MVPAFGMLFNIAVSLTQTGQLYAAFIKECQRGIVTHFNYETTPDLLNDLITWRSGNNFYCTETS